MRKKTKQGIHFLHLKGSVEERARAHGTILRDEIHQGALFALAKKNEWLIRTGPGLLREKLIQDPAVWAYKKLLVPLLDKTTDSESRKRVRALADAAGIPYVLLREAFFQPEALMLMSRVSVMQHLLSELPRGGLPGCSSAVALRDWTKSGRLLACRNMDYPIVGPWERQTVVEFNEPDQGEIPYVAVSTAGVHTAGLTAINREGLTLASHAHFGHRVKFRGRPVFSIGEEIVRNARTVGEAVDIARKYNRYAYWAFVITSARENDAVVLELSPTKVFARHPKDGLLTHTNYFQTELQEEEGLISGGVCEDMVARVCRMRDVLTPLRGQIEPAHLSSVLGDHTDAQSGIERVFGNTLSVVTTVQSVVFDPDVQKIWVSNRHESPTPLSADFVEVDIEKFWNDGIVESEVPLPAIKGYQPKNPALIEGVRHYRDAYIAWHMNNDEVNYAEKTLISLKKALSAYPDDGNLWVQAGVVAFRMKRFDEACGYFEESRKRKLTHHAGLVSRLFLARCLDISGKREEALKLYSVTERVEEPNLKAAFTSGARKPYRPNQTDEIMVDLQFTGTIHY